MNDTTSDPFDNIDALKVPQNYVSKARSKKLLTEVPCRKPSDEWFFRVNPDEKYTGDFFTLNLKEVRETYFILPEVAEALQETETKVRENTFFTCMNRASMVFLWPIPKEQDGMRDCLWYTSAREHAKRAMKNWVRMTSNMSLGAYEITVAEGVRHEPDWSTLPTFNKLLSTSFKGQFLIKDLNHPIIRQLKGEE